MSVPRAASTPAPKICAYTLVEVLRDGSKLSETFFAPSEEEAAARVEDVLEDGDAELWNGNVLIRAWKRRL